MAPLSSWTTSISESIREHEIVYLYTAPEHVHLGVRWLVNLLPEQYTHPQRIARIFRRLGRTEAAQYLEQKLPTSKTARSGELGEIIGAKYASLVLGYRMVERLRWKDHDNMPMRGDDLVGFRINDRGQIEFLKGEVKSRAQLDTKTVVEADEALRSHDGLPTPHALSFVADRLFELGEVELSDLLDEAQLKTNIRAHDVVQLLFTFSGNDSQSFLSENTKEYREEIKRFAVGLRVPEHQNFIEQVYVKVIKDA